MGEKLDMFTFSTLTCKSCKNYCEEATVDWIIVVKLQLNLIKLPNQGI